jgi:hypothetical protein
MADRLAIILEKSLSAELCAMMPVSFIIFVKNFPRVTSVRRLTKSFWIEKEKAAG